MLQFDQLACTDYKLLNAKSFHLYKDTDKNLILKFICLSKDQCWLGKHTSFFHYSLFLLRYIDNHDKIHRVCTSTAELLQRQQKAAHQPAHTALKECGGSEIKLILLDLLKTTTSLHEYKDVTISEDHNLIRYNETSKFVLPIHNDHSGADGVA